MLPEDTKLIVPQVHAEVQSRPKTGFAQNVEKKLFRGHEIDQQVKNYDIYSNNEEISNTVFAMNSPGLLALKNKNTVIKAKSRPVTVKPQTGHKTREKTIEYVSVLTPGQKRKPLPNLAAATQRFDEESTEEERMTLNFGEDPIAYFSKHKDGGGHLFIYLVFKNDRNDPDFSPYDIRKVPHSEIKDEYFTMSATGVTHMGVSGDTETVTLERWSFESACFNTIRKLKFFKFFRQWKKLQLWKNYIYYVRFSETRKSVIQMNIFCKKNFFKTSIEMLQSNCKSIIFQYLLAFVPQKKFTIAQFENQLKLNKENLETEYRKYLYNIIDLIHDLDADIRDPDRVTVKIHDVDRSSKMFPDMGYLLEASDKMKAKKEKLDAEVHQEVLDFCNFIRVADYMMLESLQQYCYECWKQAEKSVTSSMSSVFQVEVSFDDAGEVVFNPTIERLKSSVEAALDQSIVTLDNLPRIVGMKDFRPHLRERFGNLNDLYDKGPTFKQCVDFNKEYAEIKKTILTSVEKSYESAKMHSQGFKEFFNIFTLGKVWSANDYIMKRGGESVEFNLLKYACDFDRDADSLSFDPAEEYYADLRVIGKDLVKFKEEDLRISQFRACTVQGAIYIDSKNLRQSLTPIPVRSINAMKASLSKLLDDKINHISNIFKFCMKRLKKEPDTLMQFADNIEFNALVKRLSPYLDVEINFIDELTSLLNSLIYHAESQARGRSPLRSIQKQFIADQATAETISEQYYQRFITELQNSIAQTATQISGFQGIVKSAPTKMKGINIKDIMESGKNLVQRLTDIEPRVRELDRAQEIIKLNMYDFNIYDTIKDQAIELTKIYDAVNKWLAIWETISTVPFSAIKIQDFIKKVEDLDYTVEDLKRKINAPLLDDVSEKLSLIVPHLDSIDKLSSGKMSFNHWSKLFEYCGHPKGYYAQIKIDEMLQLHIFDNRDAINNISEIAQGESQLSSEFAILLQHWKEVKIPLEESQLITEDSLMIGDIGPILGDIDDAKIQVQRMLEGEYVQGVKQQVLSLGTMLENFSQVLKAWKAFQNNWIVLSVFFAKEETKRLFVQLSSQFVAVRRRWMSLVRHAADNTTLYHICEYPSLLETLREINQSLMNILDGVLKLIDNKRRIFPRLFFLSNSEVLRLFSTTDFDVFNKIVSRVFMCTKRLEVHNLEGNETEVTKNSSEQSFNRTKIYGILGESGETLILSKTIVCNGGIETWGQSLIEMMRQSVSQSITDGIYKYKNSESTCWFETIPSYTLFIVYQIMFNRDIEECFDNFENNVRSFTDYKAFLLQKIEGLSEAIHLPENKEIFYKIGLALVVLNYQLLIVQDLCAAPPGGERRNLWLSTVRLRHRVQTNQIEVHFADRQWQFGFEFWGQVQPLLVSKNTVYAFENICNSMCDGTAPFIAGSSGLGKKEITANLAQLFGKFIVFGPGFSDKSAVSVLRMIVGGIESGSWVSLDRISTFDSSTLSLLGDIIRTIRDKTDLPVEFNIANYKVRLTDDFSIFLTGGDSSKIPESLREEIQPIIINNPDIQMITKIKLQATGYKEVDELSPKLIMCARRVISLFEYIPRKSLISTLLSIISISSQMLWNNTDNRPEDFILSKAVYITFRMNAKDEHLSSLIEVIYSIFKTAKTLDKFKEEVDEPTTLPLDERVLEIAKNINTKDEYIKKKARDLLYLLFTKKCIAIYGPPNSGKSSILKETIEAINKTEGEANIKIYNVHHATSTINGVFGNFEYHKDGHVFRKGLISNVIKSINESQNQHSIIKFDGPITPEFSEIITGITSTSPDERLTFTSLEKFSLEDVSIVIETDSINNIAPNAVLYTGFLPLSCQHVFSYNPLLIFERNLCFNTLGQAGLELMRKAFIEYVPLVAKHVMKEQLLVSKEHKSYVYDILPEKALRYAFKYMDSPATDEEDPMQIKYALLQSLFILYAPLFAHSEATKLSEWICEKFEVVMPQDWAPFNVIKDYWNAFPTPSMQSCILNGVMFEPYNISILNKSFNMPHLSDKLVVPDEIRVIQPCCIPLNYQMKAWISLKQAIFIYGPEGCGKSCFLDYVFNSYPDIVPIKIPVEPASTQETLQAFINGHINLLRKPGESDVDIPRVAYIFDNVDPTNVCVLEYIRSLFSKKKQELIHYQIFVTTRFSINMFPIRFLSKFVPMSIPEQSIYTREFIFKSVAKSLMISDEYVNAANVFLSKFPNAFHSTRLLDCISLSSEKEKPLNSSNIKPVRILLAELRFLLSHKLVDDSMRKFSGYFHSTFLDPTVQAIFQPVASGSSLDFPEFSEENHFLLNYASRARNLFREELEFMLHMDTTPCDLKLDMYFFGPIINDYVLLARATCLPGGSCFLKGKEGCGRKTMCRFLAVSKDFSYYEFINQPIERTKQELSTLVREVLLKNKKLLIFTRLNTLNKEQISLLHNLRTIHDPSILYEEAKYSSILNRFAETGVAHTSNQETHLEACDKVADSIYYIYSVPEEYNISEITTVLPVVNFCVNQLDYAKQCINELIHSQEFKNSILSGHDNICDAIQEVYTLVSTTTPMTLFFDFMRNFTKVFSSEFVERDRIYDLSREAIDFLLSIEKEVKEMDEKINNLKDCSEDKEVFFKEKKAHIEAKAQSIKNRLSKIEYEENQKRQEIFEIETDLEKLKTSTVSSVRNAALAMNKLSNAPQKLNSFYGNRAFVRLFELLAFFCGDLPKFDPYGRILADDQKLKSTLEKRATVREMSPNEEKIAKQIDSMYDEYQKLSPYVCQLADYALEMSTTAKTQKQLGLKEEQLQHDKAALIQVIDNFRIERESITELLLEIKKEDSDCDKEISQYHQNNASFNEATEKRRGMDELVLRIEDLNDRWVNRSGKHESCLAKIVGSSIIFAFFLSYGGTRFDLLDEVETIVRNHRLYTGKKSSLEIVGERLGVYDAGKDQNLSDFGVSLRYRVFLQLVLHCGRTPLISDEDGYLIEAVKRTIPKPEQMTCSIKSSNVSEKVAEAAEKGITMILTDVDELTPRLEKFLHAARSNDSATPSQIGSKSVVVDYSFKLILVSSKDMETLPSELLSCITPINFNKYNIGLTREIIERTFIVHYNPQAVADIVDPIRAVVDQRVQMKRAEKELLEIISDIRITQNQDKEYVFYDDYETFNSLLQSKSTVLTLMTEIKNREGKTEENKEKRKELFRPYIDPIDIAESIWIAISKFATKVSPFFVTSFGRFLKTSESVLKENEDIKTLKKEIIRRSEEVFLPSLTIRDGLFVMFVASFLYNCRHGTGNESDIITIARHIQSEYDSKCKRTAADESGGETFEQMKFANILDIYQIAERLIRDNFDEDFFKAFNYDRIPENESIVFIKHNGTSMNRFQIGEHETFSLGSNADSIINVKGSIARAMKFGGQIVLHYDIPDEKLARFIIDNVDYIVQNPPHEKFKLIVSCTTTEFIPRSILACGKVIETKEHMSIHHTMDILSSSIKKTNDFQLEYAVSILFSLVRFRGFIKPNGLANTMYMTKNSMSSMLRKINDNKLSVSETRAELKSLFMCLFSDSRDADKVIAHLETVLTPAIKNDGFSFSKSMESNYWIIPKNEEECDAAIDALPIIPPIDTLLVNRNIWSFYYQWSLSRWISEPFLKLIEDYDVDADAKLSSIGVTVQAPIQIPYSLPDGPLSVICMKEIEVYNHTIDVIRETVKNPTQELKISIYNDVCPREWSNAIRIKTRMRTASFFRVLMARKEFIESCIKSTLPRILSTVSCSNLKQLIQYFMHKMCPDSTNDPVFEMEHSGASSQTLAVDGIELIGWSFDPKQRSLVRPNKATGPSTKLCTVYLKPKQTLSQATLIPLYVYQKQEHEVNPDDDSAEFICNIAIKGEISEADLLLNGVCAVLHQSISFEE